MLKKFIFFLKEYVSLGNIKSSLIIFFYCLLKQNTKYPKYLLSFEKQISKYFGFKYALTFSNGTTACTSLLYAVGLKKNSKIIISKLTFPSVISSILRIGAIPIYLDFDENLQIKENFDKNKIIKADFFLITHVYGLPQDYNLIKSIKDINQNLILIEDVSHAQGAVSNKQYVGTQGIGSFMSMQGDKAINAGEGGIVFTNSEKIYNKLIYLSHLNRKMDDPIKNELSLLSSIGFLGKGRMNPLGAITALNDLKSLKKRNTLLIEKIKFIHDNLNNFENLYFPKVKNYQDMGGFHYGIPFFCYSEKSLKKLKNKFKIIKFNWPILDNNDFFCDPKKFQDLLYEDQIFLSNIFDIFDKSNDLRDQLYFFDLKQIRDLSIYFINQKIILIKKDEN